MLVWPAGVFHRIISGSDGSISVNLSTRLENFDMKDNFNVYDLDTNAGEYHVIRDGFQDQPDYTYKTSDVETLKLLED